MDTVEAIVYTSDTGFTQQYARLLAEETRLPAYALNEKRPRRGAGVIYLGWLRAGRVKGLSKAARRYRVLALGVVGMSPTPNGAALADSARPAFYLPGGYRPEAVRGLSRFMMGMMGRMLQKKGAEDPETQAMLDAFSKGCDFSDPARLVPLVQWAADRKQGG